MRVTGRRGERASGAPGEARGGNECEEDECGSNQNAVLERGTAALLAAATGRLAVLYCPPTLQVPRMFRMIQSRTFVSAPGGIVRFGKDTPSS